MKAVQAFLRENGITSVQIGGEKEGTGGPSGVKFGRKRKLITEHQIGLALERLANGDSCRGIGRDMGVSHSTISRLR